MGSVPIYHDEGRMSAQAVRDLQMQIDLLQRDLADKRAPLKGDNFRGKTNVQYALENTLTVWHAREVFAKRAAIKTAKTILARGMAQLWQVNNSKFARDLLQMEKVAETHMPLALELVAILVDSER